MPSVAELGDRPRGAGGGAGGDEEAEEGWGGGRRKESGRCRCTRTFSGVRRVLPGRVALHDRGLHQPGLLDAALAAGTVGRFTWQIIRDIVGHQYVPGVLPYSFPSIFAGVHHVEHHMFSLYPLGNGFDAGWNPANVGGASESNAVAAHLEEESKIGKCDNVLDNVVFDVWMADGIIAPAKCKGEGKGLSTVEGYEDDRGDGAKGGELDCAESSPAKSRGRYNPDNAIWKRHLDMSREHEKWAW